MWPFVIGINISLVLVLTNTCQIQLSRNHQRISKQLLPSSPSGYKFVIVFSNAALHGSVTASFENKSCCDHFALADQKLGKPQCKKQEAWPTFL